MKLQSAACAIRPARGRTGFSLAELTCALFIITVGVFGVLQMYSIALDKTRTLKEYAVAHTALVNEIETLRALPFDQLADIENGPFQSVTPEIKRLMKVQCHVTITDRSQNNRGLKEVQTTIRWIGEHGRPIEKCLTTLIANKG